VEREVVDDALPTIGEGIDREAWRRRLLALRERVDVVTATAESDDGLIRATVNGRGGLLELELDARIYRVPDSRQLAARVTRAVRDAIDDVRARVATDLKDILAGRSPRT
jgi:DNA-binding protein YbaB